MKKSTILLVTLAFLLSNICYSQSGWNSIFFNNVNTISKIIKRDSLNYIALSSGYKYYYKSSDAGNNWLSIKEYAFDSAYGLFDGQFINAQTGWLIGSGSITNNGVILKTTNGGINWFEQNTGFNNYTCYCIYFLNEYTGWVGSSGGTVGYLMKTSNGGSNWSKTDFVGSYDIRRVKFFDDNSGWIMGSYIIAQTTNGGQNWVTKIINNIPPSYIFNTDMSALSMNECWALVKSANSGLIYSHFLKTLNGGDNWNLMYSYTDSLNTNANSFWNIYFVNPSIGFSNGYFRFFIRTINSGLNWSIINNISVNGNYPVIYTLLPINSNEVFAGGGGYTGINLETNYNYIIKSANTGLNWACKYYNFDYNFMQVYFSNLNTGFVLADSGKIFKTTDGGNNWNLVFHNNNYWFREMSFANSSTGCIVANQYYYYSGGKILRTTNSGDNWIDVIGPVIHSNSIKFSDQQKGWIGCDSNRILKTTDCGLTWNIMNLSNPTKYNLVTISFINSLTGWVLGYYSYNQYPFPYYYKNAIYKTINGGNNWSLVYDSTDSYGSLYDIRIQFLNENIGYRTWYMPPVVFQKTTNGGVNWFNIIFPSGLYVAPVNIAFIDANTGWAGGSSNQFSDKIIKTTNGGVNWVLQFDEYHKTPNSIFALNSEAAWFCGAHSSVYNTTNGGGIIGISNQGKNVLKSFILFQNYPNPFNPVTKIKFQIQMSPLSERGAGGFVKLIIYDLLGREVTTLVNEPMKPGTYEVDWDGRRYASGVYFYELITDEYVETKKMVLLK